MPRCKFAAWLARPDSRVAVLGASGWVGTALVDQILATDPDLAPDRLRLFGSAARPSFLRDRELRIEALDGAPGLGEGDWLILHAGIVGADRVQDGDLDVMRQRNDAMLRQVMALAETGATHRLVFFSSGAAARPEVGGPAKQAYARMKRDHEAQVATWSQRTGGPVLIPRVFNLGGPFINHAEAYALGDFILQCAHQGRIRIGSGDRVSRSFVHVAEMARGVLDMAVDPDETGEPFDVCLDRIVELDDLAGAVSKAVNPATIVERPPRTEGPGDDYRGAGDRFRAALARQGCPEVSLDQIVADTVRYLRKTGAIPPAMAAA